ncbi:MAG: 4Fe-4S dicluster domain-containing protein [Deltaproteobacteria bacterium]|nr:4Fe-4S dicluster domain-containing protein [Deltaproteobacteria bacterium]
MINIPAASFSPGDKVVIAASHLQDLAQALGNRGFTLIGPTLRNGNLVHDELKAVTDLPIGWTVEQQAGTFRLKPRRDQAFFGFTVGQHCWKPFLLPPRQRLWQARRQSDGFEVLPHQEEIPKFAFFGVRACDLNAIAVQDRIFLQGPYINPVYQARRQAAFILAVNCTQAGGNCFCASMGTGPQAISGFDLALTEILNGADHYFLIEVGTARGAEVLTEVPHEAATSEILRQAESLVQAAAAQMGRHLDTTGIKELLYRNYEHPRWEDVARRCLTCGNCTLVCPTCFCQTIEDVTDLTGQQAERWQRWDVCFTAAHSYIHGGNIRASARSRYRQWLTHKLATWIDQFGCSGCVGCGRCITWCPVGIDITEEVRAIRESEEKE